MKDWLLNVFKIVISAALLLVVVLTVDLRHVGQTLLAADRWLLLGALMLYQGGILVRAYRWQALLAGQGARVPLIKLADLYYVGTFFNSFLPSGFGGDVVKMYELARYGADGALAVSTVLADRVMGLLMLFAMAGVALPFSYRLVPPTVVLALLALIVGSVLGLWLVLNRRLAEALSHRLGWVRRLLARERVAAFYASFHGYTPAALRRAALASLLFNLSLILVYVYTGRSVGIRIGVGYYLIFVPILSSLLVLPISISGFGVREGGHVLLFGQAGVAPERALALSLLFYALNAATGVLGGVLYLVQSARSLRLRGHRHP